jgi:hypothetical protein
MNFFLSKFGFRASRWKEVEQTLTFYSFYISVPAPRFIIPWWRYIKITKIQPNQISSPKYRLLFSWTPIWQ